MRRIGVGMIIRAYDPKEATAVRDLVIRAFGQADEANLCEALRANGDMALELVAEHKKKVVGHVALSRMQGPKSWLALAPVCTDPKMQKKGIASTLCHMALQYANAPVVVLGDPKFYGQLGFDYERSKNLKTPFPIEFTGLFAPDLEDAKPTNEITYAAPFYG